MSGTEWFLLIVVVILVPLVIAVVVTLWTLEQARQRNRRNRPEGQRKQPGVARKATRSPDGESNDEAGPGGGGPNGSTTSQDSGRPDVN